MHQKDIQKWLAECVPEIPEEESGGIEETAEKNVSSHPALNSGGNADVDRQTHFESQRFTSPALGKEGSLQAPQHFGYFNYAGGFQSVSASSVVSAPQHQQLANGVKSEDGGNKNAPVPVSNGRSNKKKDREKPPVPRPKPVIVIGKRRISGKVLPIGVIKRKLAASPVIK